jgi:hypothetical protein
MNLNRLVGARAGPPGRINWGTAATVVGACAVGALQMWAVWRYTGLWPTAGNSGGQRQKGEKATPQPSVEHLVASGQVDAARERFAHEMQKRYGLSAQDSRRSAEARVLWLQACAPFDEVHPPGKANVERAHRLVKRAVECVASMTLDPVALDAFFYEVMGERGEDASGYWLLDESDVTDWGRLIARLRRPGDSLSVYISQKLTPAARAALDYSPSAAARSEHLRSAVLSKLNEAMGAPSLYEVERFQRVPLAEPIRRWALQHPMGLDRARLNRRLLEAALPGAIEPHRETSMRHIALADLDGSAPAEVVIGLTVWGPVYLGWAFCLRPTSTHPRAQTLFASEWRGWSEIVSVAAVGLSAKGPRCVAVTSTNGSSHLPLRVQLYRWRNERLWRLLGVTTSINGNWRCVDVNHDGVGELLVTDLDETPKDEDHLFGEQRTRVYRWNGQVFVDEHGRAMPSEPIGDQ